MIYNTGTISINGNTATGTGTNWTAAASQIRVSQTIIVLSNPVQMFQITAINSGTSLTVTPAASPALSGQKYGILVTDSLSVDGLAQSMSQLINEYDENIGAWETFASTSANRLVTVTINGTSLSIPAIGGLARKGANSDITELKGLTTALSIAQGGTGAKTAADARTNLGLGEWGAAGITLGSKIPWGTTGGDVIGMPLGIYRGTWNDFSETPQGAANSQGITLINLHNGSNWVPQVAIGDYINGARMWLRSFYGGEFNKFDRVNTVSETGFGAESVSLSPVATNATNLKPGMYSARGSNIGSPGGNSSGGFGVLQFTSTNDSYRVQLAAQDGSNGRIFSRATSTGSWMGGWNEFYSTANTTKSSDGTLKAASPIVQVYSDGSFQLNDESEGCTVSRLSVGEYLIEGCTGLNADAAWGGIDGGFDIPTDRNKQPLIWLDYEVNADGSILVKTYHRTHPAAPAFARNEIPGLLDGNPVDIPADQYISVRVQMNHEFLSFSSEYEIV